MWPTAFIVIAIITKSICCIPENIITPSTPNFLQGWRDNSIAISGVSERCLKGYFSEYLRKSAMYRPACCNAEVNKICSNETLDTEQIQMLGLCSIVRFMFCRRYCRYLSHEPHRCPLHILATKSSNKDISITGLEFSQHWKTVMVSSHWFTLTEAIHHYVAYQCEADEKLE